MKTVDMVAIGLWVAQLLQAAVNIIYFSNVLTRRFSPMKTAAVFLLTQSCYILFSWYFIDSGGLNWFCVVVLLLILCPILFTDGWKRIIAAICGIYLLVFLTTFLVVLMFLPFGITPHELTGGKLEMVGNFMFSFLYFAGAYIFIAFKNRRARIWSSRETMSAVLFSVIQLFLVQAVAYLMILALPALEDVTLPNAALIAGTVLCMVADILLFRMLMERSQKEQLAMQLSLMEKQSRLELTYYTSVNQKLQEVRKIRHDFNNQLQTAYGVLAQGNSEEAKTLLRQLEERIAASSPVYYCANPIVNAILWEKGQEAKERNISFETDVRLSDQLSMEKVDLCSCFSNLLDNGIRAASDCEKDRYVSVRAYEKKGYCVIQVENSAQSHEMPAVRTPKDGHGYGLPILQTIARRYEGSFTAEKIPGGVRTALTLRMEAYPESAAKKGQK